MKDEAGQVFCEHLDCAYRVALAATGNPAEAEDAVQEAFLRFVADWKSFDRSRPVRPYLARVVAHTASNRLRAERRRRTRERLRAKEEAMNPAAVPSLPVEQLIELRIAVAALPAGERLAVSLRHIEGLTLEETAAALEVPRSTAADRIDRGLEALRRALTAAGFGAAAAPAALGALGAVQAPATLKTAVAMLAAGKTMGASSAAVAAKGGMIMKMAAGVVGVGVLAGAVVMAPRVLGGTPAKAPEPKAAAAEAPSAPWTPPAAEAKPAPVNEYKGMQEREEVFEFAQKPAVAKEGDKWTVSFASKGKCDATVAIVGPDGKVVRHLASGVLGANAPHPFQQNSLSQKLEWDGLTDDFKKAPAGCKARVSLGLGAKYERDIAWDPRKGTYVEKDGKYVRTTWPPPADTPEDKLKECGLRPDKSVWGTRIFIGNKYGPFREPTGNEKAPPVEKCLAVLGPALGSQPPPRKVEFPPAALPAITKAKEGWYDKNPRLAVDAFTDELYVRGPGANTIFRFDGKTGKVDDSWFPKGDFDQVSEIDVGPDGLLYLRSSLHAYGRWLLRVDRTGKPVDFPKGEVIPPGDRQVPWALSKLQIKGMFTGVRGHSNIHQKGFDVSPAGRIVTLAMEVDATWAADHGVGNEHPGQRATGGVSEVTGLYVVVWDNDGRLLTASAVTGSDIGHGVRMDRDGNIYLCQAYLLPAGQKGLDGIPEDLSVKLRKEWGLWGGPSSLIKFRGLGDKYPVGRRYSGKALAEAPADAAKFHDYRSDKITDAFTGTLWSYNGITPQARSCSCNHGRVNDLDGYARSWIAANQVTSVMVLDANGNRVARIGSYGNVDDEGIRFAWVRAVAVSDSALYAMDWDNRRILKATLTYAAEETVPLP